MLVDIDIYSISRARFEVPEGTTVLELKELLETATSIPVNDITVAHQEPQSSVDYVKDEQTVETFYHSGMVKLILTNPSVDGLRTAHELRQEQDKANENVKGYIHKKHGVLFGDGCVSLLSHCAIDIKYDYQKTEDYERTMAGNFTKDNPPPEYTQEDEERVQRGAFHGCELDYLADKKDNWLDWLAQHGEVASGSGGYVATIVPSDVPSTRATSSEDSKRSQLMLQIENMSIVELNELIASRENELKIIKKRLAFTKKEKKGEDITINLLQPSGRTIPHTVKPKNTILQVKRSIVEELNMDKPECIRLVYDTEEMKNTKTIAGYGVDDGDVLTIVMALAGGAKKGGVQQNFLKTAKRMQANDLIQRTQNTTDQAITHCNHVANQLMALADTDVRSALRALLAENTDEKLDGCIAVLKTTHNKDTRLEGCADLLFDRITQPIKDRMKDFNGAIETTHCVFQCLVLHFDTKTPALGTQPLKTPALGTQPLKTPALGTLSGNFVKNFPNLGNFTRKLFPSATEDDDERRFLPQRQVGLEEL